MGWRCRRLRVLWVWVGWVKIGKDASSADESVSVPTRLLSGSGGVFFAEWSPPMCFSDSRVETPILQVFHDSSVPSFLGKWHDRISSSFGVFFLARLLSIDGFEFAADPEGDQRHGDREVADIVVVKEPSISGFLDDQTGDEGSGTGSKHLHA